MVKGVASPPLLANSKLYFFIPHPLSHPLYFLAVELSKYGELHLMTMVILVIVAAAFSWGRLLLGVNVEEREARGG